MKSDEILLLRGLSKQEITLWCCADHLRSLAEFEWGRKAFFFCSLVGIVGMGCPVSLPEIFQDQNGQSPESCEGKTRLARKALYKLANPPSWSKQQRETWSQKPLEDSIPPRQGLEMVPGLGEVLPRDGGGFALSVAWPVSAVLFMGLRHPLQPPRDVGPATVLLITPFLVQAREVSGEEKGGHRLCGWPGRLRRWRDSLRLYCSSLSRQLLTHRRNICLKRQVSGSAYGRGRRKCLCQLCRTRRGRAPSFPLTQGWR